MPREPGTLAAQILRLAAGDRVVDLDALCLAVHGRVGVKSTQRNRLANSVASLVARGLLDRAGRGRFRLAVTPESSVAIEDDLAADPPVDTGPRSQAPEDVLLNRFAQRENQRHAEFHEHLSELRRVLRRRQEVSDPEERPTGFPLRSNHAR